MAQQTVGHGKIRNEYRAKDTFLRRWAAVIILLLFFLGSWGGQFANQLQSQKNEAEQHGQKFQMADFWPEFWESTFENWQSEWLQLTTQALLIAAFSDYMFRKGQEDHYKTHLMIEELRSELAGKQPKHA